MLKNMKLSTKMAGGFGVVLLALIIVGATGYFKVTDVQTVVSDLSEVHMPLIDHVNEVDSAVTAQELEVMQYVLHGDQEFLDHYKKLDETVDEALEDLKNIINGDQDLVDKGWLQSVEKIAEDHDVFVSACQKLIEAVNANATKEVWDPIADEVVSLVGIVCILLGHGGHFFQ
jgi:CHASE3 domain sensor protein